MKVNISLEPPLSGVENMNADRKMLEELEGQIIRDSKDSWGNIPSVCRGRVYEWNQPTLSFGLSQKNKVEYLQPNSLAEFGNEKLVNRVTGGRVVLHYQEITYSLVAPIKSEVFGDTLHESYEKIAEVLIFFLNQLGIDAESQSRNSEAGVGHQRPKQKSFKKKSLVCYDLSGFGEITVGGKKLIGSAQKRGEHYFLQHGSIPYYRHALKVEDYLKSEFCPNEQVDYVFVSDYTTVDIAEAKQLLQTIFLSELKAD